MQIMGVTQYADGVEAGTFVLTAGASGRSGASGATDSSPPSSC
jgi:hypothetical protein